MSGDAPTPKVTAAGFLETLGDWNKEVAVWLAERDGLTLTPAHWEIIDLMRAYYADFNISPIKKLLKKEILAKLADGQTKAADAYLDGLFPSGVLIQGSKIAGLPVPMLDAELEATHSVAAHPGKAEPEPEGSALVCDGKSYLLTATGNLVEPGEWTEHLADILAEKEGLALTSEHWEVIHFLRKFYFTYGITPMVRLLMKHMTQELDKTRGSQDYLYKLFPKGPSRQGSRIAGLPAPQGCID
jgi:tRNA 2-thiouridine synthesizing protein E